MNFKKSTIACAVFISILSGCNSSSGDSSSTEIKKSSLNEFTSECMFSIDGMKPLRFIVEGKTATVDGVICDGTPETFNQMLAKYPEINRLYLRDIEGSIDDVANLDLGRSIRKNGLTTVVDSGSHITSGGVDLYLSGKKRRWSEGAKIGVHAWSDGEKDGSEYPKSATEHEQYLSYYKDMGISSDFYWFTLNAASAENMHYMTEQEIKKYGFVTEDSSFLGVTTVPKQLKAKYSLSYDFDRYTFVKAPNGKKIHILVQDQVRDEQVIRARSVLEHYLTNFSGSEFGNDKSLVANKMADNGAKLILLNGQDDGKNKASELGGQPLYQNEMQVEGGSWYIAQNYDHRDATFEEILHLVHDYGIGVDQNPDFIGALPSYQADIRSAQVDALAGKIWGLGEDNKEWLQELTEENSLSQEYLAAVVDSYYGLWGAWGYSSLTSSSKSDSLSASSDSTLTSILDETDAALEDERKKYLESYYKGGMWGIYSAKTRSEIEATDPSASNTIKKFFHPYLTYNARIDKGFDGSFSLKFDKNLPYTHHSQYLKDVTLTGEKDSSVIVNGLNNVIIGNAGNNTVIFSGEESNYTIEKLSDDEYSITDNRDNGDGIVKVKNIESLKFSSTVVSLPLH